MKNRLLFLLSLLCLLYSCKEGTNYRENVIADMSVSIVPTDETLQMSSIFKDGYDIIVPQGIVLAEISKVITTDSLMIVRGKSADGFIHLFDKQGQYIKTIVRKGGGPMEASNLNAMKMYGNDLYFLINAGTEIMRYSLQAQKVTERFRVPVDIVSIADFEVLNENEYVFYKNLTGTTGKEEYKLYVYDKGQGMITGRWLPLHSASSEYISFSQSDCLYRQGGKIRFHEVFQKGIYEWSDNRWKGYISFEENKYMMPNDELYDNYTFDSFIDFCMHSPYIWAHRGVLEGARFILSNYTYREKFYWNMIDKKIGESKSYSMIDDDVFLDEPLSAENYLSYANIQDSIYYFTISYDELAEVMEKKKNDGTFTSFTKKHQKLADIYEQATIDTNDLILMFYER